MPPLVMGRDTPLHACLEQNPKYADGYKMAAELRELYDDDPDAKRVIDVARGLEGLRRQDGIHAAAVVITREPLTEYLPIQRKPEPGSPIEESPIVTQYEMHGVEDLGLLKMDFLGLRNLVVMERALELIERSHGRSAPTSTTSRSTTRRRSSCCSGATRSACSSSKAGRCARSCARSRPRPSRTSARSWRSTGPGRWRRTGTTDYADRKNGAQAGRTTTTPTSRRSSRPPTG